MTCSAFVLALATSVAQAPASAAAEPPRTTVLRAVDRMGGEAALRAIKTLRLETAGYRNLLEQSERPDGPWIPQIERTTEWWDLAGKRWAADAAMTIADSEYSMRTVVAGGAAARRFGDRWQPAALGDVRNAEQWMGMSPVDALVAALDAASLRREPDRTFQGRPHHVVSFPWHDTRLRLFLNSTTGFLTAVESTRAYPDDFYLQIWGDVTMVASYSFWDLRPGSMFLPMQWDVSMNGRPWRALTITKIDVNPIVPDGTFDIPAEQRQAFSAATPLDDPALGLPGRAPIELADGIVHIPGSFGVTLVRQDDGIVVIEAPVSAGYSRNIVKEASRRFPNVPVKAVVSTSDAWPHIGGIREYVATHVPVYVLDDNVAQVTHAIASPHRLHPDTLAAHPAAPALHPVAARTVIGTGANRIELYPIRGETGERSMLAFFPGRQLLYGDDMVQLGRNGPPEYLWEVAEAVRRNHLEVKTVFAMHTPPTPWSRVLEIVENARKAS